MNCLLLEPVMTDPLSRSMVYFSCVGQEIEKKRKGNPSPVYVTTMGLLYSDMKCNRDIPRPLWGPLWQ